MRKRPVSLHKRHRWGKLYLGERFLCITSQKSKCLSCKPGMCLFIGLPARSQGLHILANCCLPRQCQSSCIEQTTPFYTWHTCKYKKKIKKIKRRTQGILFELNIVYSNNLMMRDYERLYTSSNHWLSEKYNMSLIYIYICASISVT